MSKPNKLVTTCSAMSAEDDGSVIGYMCRVDWECELGMAEGGNVIYPGIEDCKRVRKCTTACGIVEVSVSFRKIVEEGADNEA